MIAQNRAPYILYMSNVYVHVDPWVQIRAEKVYDIFHINARMLSYTYPTIRFESYFMAPLTLDFCTATPVNRKSLNSMKAFSAQAEFCVSLRNTLTVRAEISAMANGK